MFAWSYFNDFKILNMSEDEFVLFDHIPIVGIYVENIT